MIKENMSSQAAGYKRHYPAISKWLSRGTKPSFVHLPDELWVSIFSFLDRKQDRIAIDALRLTNKHFHRLVDNLVYWRVAHKNPGASERDDRVPALHRYARLVVEQPELRRYVKEISLMEWASQDRSRYSWLKPP